MVDVRMKIQMAGLPIHNQYLCDNGKSVRRSNSSDYGYVQIQLDDKQTCELRARNDCCSNNTCGNGMSMDCTLRNSRASCGGSNDSVPNDCPNACFYGNYNLSNTFCRYNYSSLLSDGFCYSTGCCYHGNF